MSKFVLKYYQKSTHLAFNKVSEENVYNCVGHPSKNDMVNVINWLLNDEFSTIYNRIKYKKTFEIISYLKYISFFFREGLIHLKTLRGYALQDIITEVCRFVQLSNSILTGVVNCE